MCSGSCSHSPKWLNSAGRKTISDVNYTLGSGSRDNNEHGRIIAVQRSNTWSLSAGLRTFCAVLYLA